ncbi:RagB/SusD family nutrient uptake outer membrane protein [Flavobacterium sp. GSA192]|uniref:RagB/SusD family nutrient uptake outer membrane protein n=1 Tax=Flavobacterium sp. GSA192 TaxID=2576304 RepID=UPI00112CE671|nr:RagB/SusD family nutrient uptake outer membrane protein [Flavobacterium sp. GSA192]
MNKFFLILIAFTLTFTSCEDLIDPNIANNRNLEDMYDDALFAQGILLNGYTRLPTNGWTFSDVATDDAVSNDLQNNFRRAATGQWDSNFNPFDQWTNSKAAIQYLNIFIAEADKVTWTKDEGARLLFAQRLKGEAYGLRALYMYYLLQAHAGVTDNNELLGVPILLDPESTSSNFNIPRNTFQQCLAQIYSDIEKASAMLPLDYETATTLPPGFTNLSDYNRVFDNQARQRVSKRIVMFLKAQVALLAASPAFNNGSQTAWANAADYAGELLALNGGVAGIDPNGLTWYRNAEIETLGSGVNSREVVWRGDIANSNNLELDHYPPSLFGSGRLNPTQNLVDAFPASNGYPISHPLSNYNDSNPYTNRDSRLNHFILVNGQTAGVSGSVISTASNSTTVDGLNKVETSTRTGYYMKKLLRQDINLNPQSRTQQRHYRPRMRYTELYLIYAEAANEAWGPLATASYGFSAYDVVAALRKRAGITQPDAYLESIKSDKDAMRELIRNERRLELCFEGFRFWDLRRWKENLTEPAKGVNIQVTSGLPTYTILPEVENRVFTTDMIYGPIPYFETLKFTALIQNKGWR